MESDLEGIDFRGFRIPRLGVQGLEGVEGWAEVETDEVAQK